MLLNTLALIETSINQKLHNVDVPKLINFFKYYRKGMWLYPGVLKRKFGISISDVYELLYDLEKKNILQSYYELYCGGCQKSNGYVRLFNELPEEFECELCHLELPTLNNSVLIYKVIKDD